MRVLLLAILAATIAYSPGVVSAGESWPIPDAFLACDAWPAPKATARDPTPAHKPAIVATPVVPKPKKSVLKKTTPAPATNTQGSCGPGGCGSTSNTPRWSFRRIR